jgi:hypothetical protein
MGLLARFPLPAALGGPTPPSLAAWQWQYNGLTFGAGTSFGVLKIQGLNLASIRQGDVNAPRDDGQLIGLDVYGGRDITLDLWMTGSGGLVGNQLLLAKAMQLGYATELPLWFQMPGTPNLCPNPSFEYDTIGSAPAGWVASGVGWWLNSGATLTAQSSGGAESGSHAMQVVTTSALNQEGAGCPLGVLPAGTYTASAYVKGAAGGEALELFAGIVSPGTGDRTLSFTATTAFVRQSVTFTSDGATASYVGVKTTTATAVTFYVDAVMVTSGATLTAYVDGDTLGYYWTGVPGDSTSAPLLLCAMSRTRKRDMDWDAEYAAGAVGKPTARFHATDPRIYLPGQSTTISLSSSGGGGLTFPVGPFPVTFGASSSGSVTVYNQGDCETRPILVFNGPVTNPWVQNNGLANSPYVQFQNPYQTGYTVLVGDQLVVDLGVPHRVLYYSGGFASGSNPSPVPDWLTDTSTWWNLPPGANPLRYGSSDTSTSGIGACDVLAASAFQL